MLETLKDAGKNIGRELNRVWENLSEGWRELYSRSNQALTSFYRGREAEEGTELAVPLDEFPRWGLLAGEVEETGKEIVVRLEVPGMDKADCDITIEGNTLYLSGEKRIERVSHDSAYHVMERAYGAFRRAIPLPRNVDADKAKASYRNGVLTVRLPKTGSDQERSIPVS